ncbi:MAG: hypothetical protein R2758_07120 [Bacteroidales bacterium]
MIAYTTLPEETQHFYNWGIWTGNRMEKQQDLQRAAPSQGSTGKSRREILNPTTQECTVPDHNDPSTVYLSRPVNDRYEIEEWITGDGGRSFSGTAITSKSLKDNVRPFVARNSPESLSPRNVDAVANH